MEPLENDEISLRELSKKIDNLIKYFKSKWYIILIFVTVSSAVGFIYAYSQNPKYSGTLTFVLSTESKTSNFSGLASQFGVDLGSGGANDVFTGDNIITLFKSNKMIRRTLFKKPPYTSSILINIITHDLRLDKKWNEKAHLKDAYPFSVNGKTSPIQDSLINEICTKINENFLSISRPDKKLSSYVVSTTSCNEIFSCYLTRFLVDETAKFYIDTKTSIAKQNLLMLQKEADSIRNLLGSSIHSTASEVDRTFNLNPALQIQRSSIQRGQINTTVLGNAYGEVIKNLELAKINLQKETPLYQIIDEPTLPLKSLKVSKIIWSAIGFLIGLFLSLMILMYKKWKLVK